MKRQAAFIDAKQHLKGALHVHTTRSDGAGTPEEVIQKHIDNGYAFMALTDHHIYNYSNFGKPITMIPGIELNTDMPGPGVRCHHIVCIGPEKANGNKIEQDERIEGVRIEKPEETQALIDRMHERGNLTMYCHPEWSGTPTRDYDMLRGNFAMEVCNTSSVSCDGLDADAPGWDELLADGQRIFGVADDDGHAMREHCKGWVMVNSENSVDAILDGLKSGAFYSSCGPEIYDFYIEDGVAHVKCSPVAEIGFRHLRAPYRVTRPAEGQTEITEGAVKLRRSHGAQYIRAWVRDAQGRMAWTNPIFLDDGDFVD